MGTRPRPKHRKALQLRRLLTVVPARLPQQRQFEQERLGVFLGPSCAFPRLLESLLETTRGCTVRRSTVNFP